MDFQTDDDLRVQLARLIEGFPSMRACAESLGIDYSYLTRVMSGSRPVGATLAHVLGYTPRQVYEYTRHSGRPKKERGNG